MYYVIIPLGAPLAQVGMTRELARVSCVFVSMLKYTSATSLQAPLPFVGGLVQR